MAPQPGQPGIGQHPHTVGFPVFAANPQLKAQNVRNGGR
jgi:hypothetical protein